MALSKTGTWGIAAAAVTAGGLLFAGPALAATSTTSTSTAAASQTATGDHGGSGSTPVTGTEATKATQAVTAKDSSVSVTGVHKDADGTYDVLGTKAGASVKFDVSADLTTVTQSAGGHGDHGGSGGTPVTGTEAAKATQAVTAKDSSVSVTGVHKDTDGSYDVLGTKAGASVKFDVSADLTTVTQSADGHGSSGQSSAGA